MGQRRDRPQSTGLTILAFADIQQQPDIFSRLLDHTWASADYLLGIGDYLQNGCPQRCDEWTPFLAAFNGRDFSGIHDIALGRGNHEDLAWWVRADFPLWQLRRWGSVAVAILDSGEEVPIRLSLLSGGAQRTWLADILGGAAWTSARWRIAAFHHPDKVDHWAGCFYVERQEIRETMDLLLDAGVDLILHGHSHAYARRRLRTGALQIICGGGGGWLDTTRCWQQPETQLAFASHHVLLIDANKQLTVRAIGTDGRELDRVTR